MGTPLFTARAKRAKTSSRLISRIEKPVTREGCSSVSPTPSVVD
jgi:hypothetical protein